MPCTSQALELIRNGKAQSVIVIGAKAHPYIRDAARELQKHLRLLTGAELPILSDKNILHNKTAICVGDSLITEKAGYKKTRFPKGTSAYEIVVRGRNVILNGPVSFYKRTPSSWEKSFHAQGQSNVLSSLQRSLTDDNGVMHSVSAFLEMLGVRFYAPGKKGTFYPRKKDVVLKETHIVKQAAFPVREYHFSSGTKLDGETLSFLKGIYPNIKSFIPLPMDHCRGICVQNLLWLPWKTGGPLCWLYAVMSRR